MADVAKGRDLAVVERPSAHGQALTMDAPAPGTYWRLRKATEGTYTHRIQAPEMDEGTVLMLASIEYADGQPHVYHFADHPSTPRDEQEDISFHADDFYAWWEPAPDGEAVRAAELLELMQDMEETKALMLAPPPECAPAALLAHDPAAEVGQPGQALATPDQVQAMTLHAQRLKEDAERRSSWITEHSQALAIQGGLLANFHQERAQAAMARAQAQLEGVKGILKTVENLRLYTGEGFDVMPLREGAPAPAHARLTIYQDVLALDEEALILLDQGGLDHTRTDELIQALKDEALLARLIPAKRGIVLVRFRNSYKEFISVAGDGSAKDAAAVKYNCEMSRESQRKRLLVRDGERLWLIDAPEVLEPIQQLMPSAGEQDAYFRRDRWGREPERITREDLDYARAQRRQMFALDHYGKVLIVLWGLHDRTEMFEGAHIPRFTNWLDPAFQEAYLTLVNQDTLLGVARPDFAQWQAEQNAYLAAGAWVAVDLGQAFTEAHAPGAYSKGSYWQGRTHYDQLYQPQLPDGDMAVHVDRVRKDAKGLYVDVPCVYRGYGRVRREQINVKLYLRYREAAERTVEGVLVLDRVHAPDLSYYLESRSQRRAYKSYISLFRGARDWVAQRDEGEKALREQLRAAAVDGGLPIDPDRIESALTDAIAVARTARRDREIPASHTPAFARFLTAALGALHAAVTDNTARVHAIEAWAATHARHPLRLVLTGRGTWKLYLVPADAEHDARLGAPVHATAAEVRFTSDGSVAVEPKSRELLRAAAREQVIHDWPSAAQWLAMAPPFTAGYRDAVETLDLAIAHTKALEDLDLSELVERAADYIRVASKRMVRRMDLHVVIGSALRDGKPVAVLAFADALHYAHALGDGAVRAACHKVVNRFYANPQSHLEALGKALEPKWSVATCAIDALLPHRNSERIEGDLRCQYLSRDQFPASGKKPTRFQLDRLTLSPLGARLVPWLRDFTEVALG